MEDCQREILTLPHMHQKLLGISRTFHFLSDLGYPKALYFGLACNSSVISCNKVIECTQIHGLFKHIFLLMYRDIAAKIRILAKHEAQTLEEDCH